MQEVNEAAELIHAEAHDEANIIWGMVIDPNLSDKVRVTVIATGFGEHGAASVGTPLEEKPISSIPKTGIGSTGIGVIPLRKVSVIGGDDEEKLDIPTFLRKQAD